MLRNRSPRAVTTKQGLMTDHSTSLISPNKKANSSPISSFLGSPRLFNGFLSKNLSSDAEQHQPPTMSPTSILDLKNSPSFINPFGYDRSLSKTPTPCPETSSSRPGAIGLALIDSIVDKKKDGSITRTALSKLKVQIPDMSNYNSNNNNSSSGDFGIKTRSCQVTTSPVSEKEGLVKRQMSLKEMEMSEDYTCVIIHGPNPKTKHIFDDCIVECECSCINNNKDDDKVSGGSGSSPGFLSFCYTCREVLGQDKDIYMYRGEKAFCSHECRCQEMYLEKLRNPHHSHDAF